MEANPLIVIVGPTASGKTALAIELAKKFKGEIICADSRTVYRHMDIGTAKPTLEEQKKVPHWGLDLASPGERFTASDFKTYAESRVKDISSRGRVPFLVGGTGLYVDSIIFDFQFGGDVDLTKRKYLETLTLEELFKYCENHNIALPENNKNKRYVIRAIEQKGVNTKRRDKPSNNIIIVGISTNLEILKRRIEKRAEQIFEDGVVEEAKILGEMYGWNSEAMTGNVYPLCHSYLAGDITSSELKEKFITLDWRLAKRQLTWLRRNKYIHWLTIDEARLYLSSVLDNEH